MAKDKTTQVSPVAMAAAASDVATVSQAKVIKPAVAATTQAQASTPVLSQEMQQFKTLCENFVKVKTGSKTNTVDGPKVTTYAERGLKAFRNLMNFVWAHQGSLDVLNGLRQFFVVHRDTILSHSQAMPQIGTLITSETERSRLEFMWLLMYELTNKARTRNTYEFELASRFIRNPNCNPENGFVQYVSSRMR